MAQFELAFRNANYVSSPERPYLSNLEAYRFGNLLRREAERLAGCKLSYLGIGYSNTLRKLASALILFTTASGAAAARTLRVLIQ